MSFRDLPGRLRVYLATTVAAAGAALFAALPGHRFHDLPLFAALVALAVLAGALKVELTIRWGRMNLGSAVTYFTMVALGVPEAALVNAVTAVASMGLNRRHEGRRHGFAGIPPYRFLFNVANHVLAAIASGIVFQWLGGRFGGMELERAVGPILGSMVAYYAANTLGIATAVAWSQGMPVLAVWRENFLWTAPGYLAAACAAAGMAHLYHDWGIASLLLLPPSYIVYYSYRLYMEKIHSDIRHITELNELNSSVIASLAMAIDAKDRYTHKHINRVREYAVGLAERLQVGREELEAIKIAALLHDIGKIGVPEHILGKPGKLTPDEFEQIKAHVTIGAMILEPVRFPWPVIPIVLTHHERWDGNGYPNGLRGEEIPIGGRIVALADVFDALTSTRPYRAAMEREKAIDFLRAGAGTQFDPRAVAAFIEALPQIEERIRQMELSEDAAEEPEAGEAPRTICANVLEQIARANAESFALSELADLIAARPEIDATLDLILQKVRKLVPFSTCAVFLADAEMSELRAVRVTGLLTELFADMAIKVGEGASGWVVAQNEPVLNSPASLDVARRLKPTDVLELNSTLSVPLMAEGAVLGALTLYHTGYNFYKPHHQRLLALIAEHAGPAIESARQFARTRQLAMEDAVTGLPNARALTHFLRHQIAECARRETEFTVLLMDVDNFKQVNDLFGHLEGDRVLEHVSRVLQASVREMDFVARYAGDEFVIVLPYAGLAQAEEITARVRPAVQGRPVDGAPFELGISIGHAVYPADGTDVRSLLGIADGRMYAEKSERKRAAVV